MSKNKLIIESKWNVDSLKEYFDVRFEALYMAIGKADAANEKQFKNTNEWRGSLNDVTEKSLPRTEYIQGMKPLDTLKERFDKSEGTKDGGTKNMYLIIAAVSFIISIISFGMMIYNKQ